MHITLVIKACTNLLSGIHTYHILRASASPFHIQQTHTLVAQTIHKCAYAHVQSKNIVVRRKDRQRQTQRYVEGGKGDGEKEKGEDREERTQERKQRRDRKIQGRQEREGKREGRQERERRLDREKSSIHQSCRLWRVIIEQENEEHFLNSTACKFNFKRLRI